jgi:tetratricopeptide (TPR) repeat protein
VPETSEQLNRDTPDGGVARKAPAVLRTAAVCLLAFVALYEPMCCGVTAEPGPLAVFFLLLLACAFCLVCEGALAGKLQWRMGRSGLFGALFLAWMCVSCFWSSNKFAGAQVCLLFASYGLLAFLVFQLAADVSVRRFLISCAVATGVALTLFALIHHAAYAPAMAKWLERDPYYFRSVFDVQDGMFKDLEIRVRGNRAVGNFITSNQLASFLLLAVLPLAGIAAAAGGRRKAAAQRHGSAPFIILALAALLACVALYLSGSKGGMAAFVFGVLVFALANAGGWLSRHKLTVLAACVLIVLLFMGGQRAGVLPRWEQFKASLGVRLDYWRVSVEMIRQHPLTGIGPGCWKEHYAMLKAPEYEETRLAHNAYLQIWTETGTVGFALFCLFLGGMVLRTLRGMARTGGEGEPESEGRTLKPFLGYLLAAVALSADYLFIGTFKPPAEGSAAVLDAAPWLIYILLFGAWAAAFWAVYETLGAPACRSVILYGLAAGVGAFLLHSGAEFTFRVPALGVTAIVFASVLLLAVAPPRTREMLWPQTTGAAAIILVFAVVMPWATIAIPRVLDYSLGKQEVFALKGEMAGRGRDGGTLPMTPKDLLERRLKIIKAYRKSVAAIPWDDDCWCEMAANEFALAVEMKTVPDARRLLADAPGVSELLRDAEANLRRAIELNPLRSKNHSALGNLLAQTGRSREAVMHMERAARLHPSMPDAWLQLARVAEESEGLSRRACHAYALALELSRRQYHVRNRLDTAEETLVRQKLAICRGERTSQERQP